MGTRKLVIIGAGGFARELKWLAAEITADSHTAGSYEFVGYLVSDTASTSPYDSSDEILGDFNWLQDNPDAYDCLAMGIGNAAPRLKVADELELMLETKESSALWPTMIHPSAQFDHSTAKIDYGVQICASVTGTVNLELEPFALVGVGCTLGHEAVLRRACTLNPGANISGGVDIGAGALIGTGAQVLQYLKVGQGAIVGGGAVVTRDVDDDALVVGVPARAR